MQTSTASRRAFALLILILPAISACTTTPEKPMDMFEAIELMPTEYRPDLVKALAAAEDNQHELIAAVQAAEPARREDLAFLIANMPQRDLSTLNKDYLLDNVEYAHKAMAKAPWADTIPHDIFLNDILPYASINERRDNWRKDFHDRFAPVVADCKTPGEAAMKLNREIFKTLKVKYHPTKRPKPDQSPYESIDAGYASCSGLSILLIDACRAVGVPARFVGVPMWHNKRGNHSWVEVWDGQWRFVGAAEPGKLDKTWFAANAKKADASKVEHSVYAASFRRTGTWFPLIWDTDIKYVEAFNVTPFYTNRRTVTLRIVDKPGGKPVEGSVTLLLGGGTVAKAAITNAIDLILAGGQTYQARISIKGTDKIIEREISIPAEGDEAVEIVIGG